MSYQQQKDEMGEMLAEDKEYSQHEFTFTFTRAELSAIQASLEICRLQLEPGTARSLCRSALAKIGAHEQYQRSKRPAKGRLS